MLNWFTLGPENAVKSQSSVGDSIKVLKRVLSLFDQ